MSEWRTNKRTGKRFPTQMQELKAEYLTPGELRIIGLMLDPRLRKGRFPDLSSPARENASWGPWAVVTTKASDDGTIRATVDQILDDGPDHGKWLLEIEYELGDDSGAVEEVAHETFFDRFEAIRRGKEQVAQLEQS